MEHFVSTWGYLALFVLTIAEAACVPIPSEVSIAVAGYLASPSATAAGHHRLNIVLVILVATVGEVIGAFGGYALGRFGGRPLVERFGRYVLISHHDLDRAERWFSRRGDWGVLVGRVLPFVRTFISLPAGLAGMRLWRFGVFTALGSLVWMTALGTAAYELGGEWNKLTKGFNLAGVVLAALVVVAIAVFVVQRWRATRGEPEEVVAQG